MFWCESFEVFAATAGSYDLPWAVQANLAACWAGTEGYCLSIRDRSSANRPALVYADGDWTCTANPGSWVKRTKPMATGDRYADKSDSGRTWQVVAPWGGTGQFVMVDDTGMVCLSDGECRSLYAPVMRQLADATTLTVPLRRVN